MNKGLSLKRRKQSIKQLKLDSFILSYQCSVGRVLIKNPESKTRGRTSRSEAGLKAKTNLGS